MRIGIFTDSYKPYICGVTTSVEMLSEGLKELGHEVYIVCMKLNRKKRAGFTDDENVIRIGGIPLLKKGLKDFRLSFFKEIKVRTLYKYNFDLVHIHTEFSIGNLGLEYAKRKKVPFIYTAHTLWEDYFNFISMFLARYAKKQLMWGLKKLIYRYTSKASYTIVPSSKMKERLVEYGLDSNYKIVPTGIDISLFKEENINRKKTAELRQRLGLNDNDFCYLFLGRISNEKNIVMILKTFWKLNISNTKLLIVGSGPALDELEEIVKENNAKDKVIFTGEVLWRDVRYYYNIADCFLNASTSETQGLTYIEALSSSLPVILWKDPVLKNIIKENVNGLLFENENDLLEKMELVYNNFNLRKYLSKNALKSVEKYSKECYTNSVLNLYETIIIW